MMSKENDSHFDMLDPLAYSRIMHDHTHAQLTAATSPPIRNDPNTRPGAASIVAGQKPTSKNKKAPAAPFNAKNLHLPTKYRGSSEDESANDLEDEENSPDRFHNHEVTVPGRLETSLAKLNLKEGGGYGEEHAPTRLRCECQECEGCRKRRASLARNGMCLVEAIGRRDTT